MKKKIVEAFADAIKMVVPDYYVAAPDMYMAEEEMGWISRKLKNRKVVTGKPKSLGGIPHELGSTGFGVAHSVKVALNHMGLDVRNVTFAVEGFGNVGSFVVKYLTEAGAKLVATSDSKGTICNYEGIDFEKLSSVKLKKGSVIDYGSGKKMKCADILDVKADILVTAAVPDLVKDKDVSKLKFKLIVEGSNIPMKPEVEEKLYKRKIMVVPDFVANAGGVISSYVEYKGGSVNEMFKLVEKKVKANTLEVLKLAKSARCSPRKAAMDIARKRIFKKCKTCRI